MQPALLGGVFIGVLSALPVVSIGNYCCCMWIIAGGMLAAYLDQAPDRAGNLARGALDGFMAGIVGAFVFVIVASVVSTVMAPLQERMIAELLDGGYDLPPEVRHLFERTRDSGTTFFWTIAGFFVHLFAGLIFGTLGGLLGAVFFWRDNVPPALGGPQAPPPLPPQ